MKKAFKILATQILRICVIAIISAIGFSIAACDSGNGSGTSSGLSAPTGLTATPTSSTVIKLTWNKVKGAYRYNVYASLSQSSGFQLVARI